MQEAYQQMTWKINQINNMLMHLIIVQHFLLRQLTHVIQSKDRKI